VAATAALAGHANSARADDTFPHWEFLGPPSAPLDALAVAPSDPEIVYGSYEGRFFASTDGGRHWELRSDPIGISQDDGIAVDPRDPNIILWGSSLLRSTDGGRNWTRLDEWVEMIAYSPADPSVVYGASNWTPFYNSHDGGVTWRKIDLPRSSRELKIRQIAPSPTDPEVAYIATTAGFFVTRDGGESADLIGFEEDYWLTGVTVSAAGQETIYLYGKPDISRMEIRASTDGGRVWSELTTQFGTSGLWIENLSLAADPAEAGTLYVGLGAVSSELHGSGSVLVSHDGGVTWDELGGGLTRTTICEVILVPSRGDLWCRPQWIGPFICERGTGSWTPRHTGLFSQPVRGFAIDPRDPDRMYVPLFDPGVLYRTMNGGRNWELINAEGLLHTQILVNGIDGTKLLAEAPYGGTSLSADSGSTWQYQPKPPMMLASLSVSPLYPDRVLACGKWPADGAVLYLSDDFGQTWNKLVTGRDDKWGVMAVIAPSDPNRMYAGLYLNKGFADTETAETAPSYDCMILRSDDGGARWIVVQEQVPEIEQLLVDPKDPDTVYWHKSGYLCKSTDAGASYQNIEPKKEDKNGILE